jgi:hypothetical protein
MVMVVFSLLVLSLPSVCCVSNYRNTMSPTPLLLVVDRFMVEMPDGRSVVQQVKYAESGGSLEKTARSMIPESVVFVIASDRYPWILTGTALIKK